MIDRYYYIRGWPEKPNPQFLSGIDKIHFINLRITPQDLDRYVFNYPYHFRGSMLVFEDCRFSAIDLWPHIPTVKTISMFGVDALTRLGFEMMFSWPSEVHITWEG